MIRGKLKSGIQNGNREAFYRLAGLLIGHLPSYAGPDRHGQLCGHHRPWKDHHVVESGGGVETRQRRIGVDAPISRANPRCEVPLGIGDRSAVVVGVEQVHEDSGQGATGCIGNSSFDAATEGQRRISPLSTGWRHCEPYRILHVCYVVEELGCVERRTVARVVILVVFSHELDLIGARAD